MTTNMTPEQERDILKMAEECADEMRAKDAATIAQLKEEIAYCKLNYAEVKTMYQDACKEIIELRKELEEAGEPEGYFQDCDLKQLARLDNRTFAMQVVAGRTKHIGMSPLYAHPPIREGWVMVQSSRIENMESFIHDIANEVYLYTDHGVRKASELLLAVKKD